MPISTANLKALLVHDRDVLPPTHCSVAIICISFEDTQYVEKKLETEDSGNTYEKHKGICRTVT